MIKGNRKVTVNQCRTGLQNNLAGPGKGVRVRLLRLEWKFCCLFIAL